MKSGLLCAVALLGLLGLKLHGAFVVQRLNNGAHEREARTEVAGQGLQSSLELEQAVEQYSAWDSTFRLLAGVALSAVLLVGAAPARADVEDVVIAVDEKGKTTSLTKEGVVRGKRLFNAACAICHIGGGTKTNQNVGLSTEELSGASPNRNTVEGLIDYLNNPTTYDGLKDISEIHPSIKAADVWPKMRSMQQQDLYDMSAYILYMNQVIPEKWGGGKQYY
eukprot:TRINITY_DN56_c0_g2_i7.p1 TRINITY_DN56_c0_g2~~TRINITY_DN56_c0_g2_i7.p1  ORF type:complete len:222 (-),score=50.67 TRINITY_DN56_c0_g2_i7:49-714(-)